MCNFFCVFPFDKVEKGSKIIIYGARSVAKAYLRQLQAIDYCNVLFAVDRDYLQIQNVSGVEVKSPNSLVDADCDYIVLAVRNVFLQSVLSDLKLMGIQANKIKHSEPLKTDDGGTLNHPQISHSLYGDDLFILNTFKTLGIQNPSYIDVGCHDPYSTSNTAVLYSVGCRGINIDANPNLLHLFHKERPEDINLNIGIGDKYDTLTFYISNNPSISSFSLNWVEDFIKQTPELEIQEVVDVPVVPLIDIVNKYSNGKWPDYLDVDAEGLDYDIISSCDFSKDGPSLVCVECHGDEIDKMNAMMSGKGYDAYCRLVTNQFYLRKGLRERILRI